MPNCGKSLAVLLFASALHAGQGPPEVADVLREGARLVATGRIEAAQEFYERARSRFPRDPDLAFELGMVYFRRHEWEKAAESYRISLSIRPGSIKPLFYLSQAYYMQSDLHLARETIRQAADIAPNDPQVCQKYGEYLSMEVETRKDALAWLEKARRLSPGLARIDFDIGLAQFELSDYPSAVSSFESALQKNSGDGQAAFFLAECWAKLNDWEKALKYYDLALAQGYANGPAYYGRGRALVELGEDEAALVPLQRARVVQPALIHTHFQLSKAYRRLGRIEEARRETRLFSAMTNRIDTSRELRGPEEESAWKRTKPLLEANKEREALEMLAKSPAAHALDRAESHYLLGVVYHGLGRKDDAVRMLRIARKAVPDSARIAAYLGVVELASGKSGAAAESFRSALALDSAEVLALIGLGRIRYQQQRWSDAVECLEKSRTADPGTLYLLCDAYFRVNRTEDAMLTAEVIRAFGSGDKALLTSLDELVRVHESSPRSWAPPTRSLP